MRPMVGRISMLRILVPCLGQLHGRFGVDGGEPAGHRLHPLTVVKTADVRTVHKARAVRKAAMDRAIERRRFHLCKPCRNGAEHEHDLAHALIGGKAEHGRTHIQHIVFRGGKVICQCAIRSGTVDLVDDLIVLRLIVGASDERSEERRVGKEC